MKSIQKKRRLSFFYALLIPICLSFIAVPHQSFSAEEPASFTVAWTTASPIMAKTGESISVQYLVTNTSDNEMTLSSEVVLPEKWSLVFGMKKPMTLKPGESKLNMAIVKSNGMAAAGEYSIQCVVKDENTPYTQVSKEISVVIEEFVNITGSVEVKPEIIIAGETYSIEYNVYNQGNFPVDLMMSVASTPQMPIKITPEEFSILPGSSTSVKITCNTDVSLKKQATQKITLIASSKKDDTILARIPTSVMLIPSPEAYEGYFLSIPSEFKISYKEQNSKRELMVDIKGEGTINKEKNSRVEYMFHRPYYQEPDLKKPNNDLRLYANYYQDSGSLQLGDNSYTLSRLTENGRYGRGMKSIVSNDIVSLEAFYVQNHPDSERPEQGKGVKIAVAPHEYVEVGCNLFDTKQLFTPDVYGGITYTVDVQMKNVKNHKIYTEYGKSVRRGYAETHSAY